MPFSSDRVTEQDVSIAVLHVLSGIDKGAAPIAYLVRNAPKYLDLSPSDLAPSMSRPQESVWEQQVRNITSHHDAVGNFVCDGYLARIDGGLLITDLGRNYLQKLAA